MKIKHRNEELNRVLMGRKSAVFKDKKHPSRQNRKLAVKKQAESFRDGGE